MTHEAVYKLLAEYRMNKGRCGHLAAEINRLTNELAVAMAAVADDVAAVRPQKLTDMPHGTSVSNPTETLGLMLASGWKTEEVRDLEEEMQKLQKEYGDVAIRVSYVEAWLKGLTDKEKWIVEQSIIDGEFWRSIVSNYSRIFDVYVSKDTLKRLKARALDKIYDMAK